MKNWKKTDTQLPGDCPIADYPRDEGAVVPGTFYEYDILDEVTVVFPPRLGGETISTTFASKPVLFVEDPPPGATEARIWVSSMRYDIDGINFLSDVDGDGEPDHVETGPFVLGRLSSEMSSLHEPPGRVNLATGAYEITYVVHIDMPVPGVEDLGVFVETEHGVMDIETGIRDITSSSVSIESDFFAGTEVFYAPREVQTGEIQISCNVGRAVPAPGIEGLRQWIPRMYGSCCYQSTYKKAWPDVLYACRYRKYIPGGKWYPYVSGKGVSRWALDYDTWIKKHNTPGKGWWKLPKDYVGWTKYWNGVLVKGWWEVELWKTQKCYWFPPYAVLEFEVMDY